MSGTDVPCQSEPQLIPSGGSSHHTQRVSEREREGRYIEQPPHTESERERERHRERYREKGKIGDYIREIIITKRTRFGVVASRFAPSTVNSDVYVFQEKE